MPIRYVCVSVCVFFSRTICNFSTLKKMTSALVFFPHFVPTFSVEKCVIIFYKLNSIRVLSTCVWFFVCYCLYNAAWRFSQVSTLIGSPLPPKLVPAFVIFLACWSWATTTSPWVWFEQFGSRPGGALYTAEESFCRDDDLCAGYPH